MKLRARFRRLLMVSCALLVCAPATRMIAQDDDSSMSQKEIESLRDAAYVPNDRVMAFIKILNTREQEIEDLLAKPRRPGFNEDMHDLLDQFAAITDEFNDNLDEFQSKHRDIRKSLPKLVAAIERWQTTLRAPADANAYNVVRRMALDSLKDMHETATTMQTEQAEYFKAHPDAAKTEKDRADPEHAPLPQ
jgi:septal ring factor EnvC (AmiA/AmiB activator)